MKITYIFLLGLISIQCTSRKIRYLSESTWEPTNSFASKHEVKSRRQIDYPSSSDINPNLFLKLPEVRKWLHYFTRKGRARFQRYLHRGGKFVRPIANALRKEGLPKELYYLALIESGFSPIAKSSMNATGLWQFMRPTAREMGLRINRYIDERRDPFRSTLAATRYLKQLHGIFQSWHLAVAAYNSGIGRVKRAIQKANSRNFWMLIPYLPPETRDYLPKLLAATHIGNNLSHYGFKKGSHYRKRTVSFQIPSPVSIKDIARYSNASAKEIRALNPQILRTTTPPQYKYYRVWLPQKTRINLAALKRKSYRRRNSKNLRYRVRRGDTLWGVAKKFQTSIKVIKRLNAMNHSRLYAGQLLKIDS